MPLIPLKIPAGFYRTGTDLDAAGRWRDGSLVRWRDGSLRPIGGWRVNKNIASITTNAPRGMHTWESNNGTRYVANQGSTIGLNTWHCVGVTYTNYTKTAYIDGVAVGTQTCGSSGNLDSSVSNRRLGRYGTQSYALSGNLGPFMVWDRVLSATEVKDLFDAQRSRFGV